MKDDKALEIINKIFKSVFDKDNNYSLDTLLGRITRGCLELGLLK